MADSTHGVAPPACDPWAGPGGAVCRPARNLERPLEVTHGYVEFYHAKPGMLVEGGPEDGSGSQPSTGISTRPRGLLYWLRPKNCNPTIARDVRDFRVL